MPGGARPESVRSRLWVLLVLGVTGMAGSIVVYRALQLREEGLFESNFRFDAQQRVGVIQRSLTVNLEAVGALVAFYSASQSVEPDEFATFTKPLLAQRPGIQELGWAHVVTAQGRAAYEQRVVPGKSAQGITEFDTEGRLVPARERAEYLPVEYLRPHQHNALAVGFDLASSPPFYEAIQRARESGRLEVTARVRLDGSSGASWGFAVVAPVYRKGASAETPSQRRENLEGMIVGVYRLETLVEMALARSEVLGIDVCLFDQSPADGEYLLCVHHSRLRREPPSESEPTSAEVLSGVHYATPMDLPGREWWAYCRPTDAYAARNDTALPEFALAASLLTTGLLLGYVNSLLGRNARVRQLVERQTGQLRQANADLQRQEAERQRADEVLRDSQTLYSSLVETLPVQVLRKNIEGRFIFANQSFCQLIHRQPEEILGKTDFDLYPEDLAEKFRRDDRRVIETGELFETVEENTQDGQRRYVQVMKFPVRDAAGHVIGVQVIFWDVTQRKQAEAALEQERYLLHALMDNLPHNIYFKDLQSRFLRINKALARYFGLADAAEARGKNDRDFFSAEHAEEALIDEQAIIASGQPMLNKEEKETWPDGRVTWAASAKLPLYDQQGQIVGTFGISRDVTEQKMAAEALRAAKEAAESASRAKSDFLANMSHEIRTPLNAIIGMTELVLDGPLNSSQRDYLKMVRDSGECLLLVINDILDFSKIEAGKLDLECTPFDLRESLGDTLRSLAVRAHAQGLELACRIPPDVPDFLVGDPGRLRQIVINLVGNAIKFTERGEVVLDVRCEARDEDHVVLHFCVADTGIGVPSDKLTAIFEMFEQADMSTTRKRGGTGLGLAICSRLVEHMGGRIWAESEVGRGSRFHFTARFVLTDGRAPQAVAAEPEVVRGLRVLVVDDNATNCLILEEMLTNWDMRPISVQGVGQAIVVLEQALDRGDPFRLVLTDANMPELDGFTLAERIKQDPRFGSTVIMMLTSGDRPGDVARCEDLGIAAYLMKPIKQSELLDAILMVLGVAAGEIEVQGGAAVEPPVCTPPLHILLAEDSLVNQKLAVGLLERQGHSVVVANNGQEAVAAIGMQPFDLILMDVQMPDMDGLEATIQIRARERRTGGHVPIIAMTAHTMRGDRQRCLDAGMDEYVAKPIRVKRLLETIAGVMAGRTVGVPADAALAAGQAAGPDATATAQRTVAVGATTAEPSRTEPELSVTPEGGAMVDWSEALTAVRGDRRLLYGVVEAFLGEAPRLMDDVCQAVERHDPVALRLSAHTLKGSVRYFGATVVYDRAYTLERMGQTGDMAGAEQVLADLEREMLRLVPELAIYRNDITQRHD
jgi:two-component system sensor histidine kinase/response regulator